MKLFKRGKDRPGDQPAGGDPRSTFAVAPLPRHAGPPASSTPLADQLGRGGPGVTDGYVVLPRGLAEQMPLPWQRQAASVLAQFHHTHRQLAWPRYRVLPSRQERLVDLDEEQLAEAGYVVELDVNGELVYRERNGRKVGDPEQTMVLVTCLDPVQPNRPAAAPQPQASGADAAGGAPTPAARPPVPMNIGPQPKWDVVPSKAHPEPPAPAVPPPAPPAPMPPAVPPAPPAVPEPAAAEVKTPPRGIPVPPEPSEAVEAVEPIDWFAESADEPVDEPVEPREAGFGPTGEPIEQPYRFRS